MSPAANVRNRGFSPRPTVKANFHSVLPNSNDRYRTSGTPLHSRWRVVWLILGFVFGGFGIFNLNLSGANKS